MCSSEILKRWRCERQKLRSRRRERKGEEGKGSGAATQLKTRLGFVSNTERETDGKCG